MPSFNTVVKNDCDYVLNALNNHKGKKYAFPIFKKSSHNYANIFVAINGENYYSEFLVHSLFNRRRVSRYEFSDSVITYTITIETENYDGLNIPEEIQQTLTSYDGMHYLSTLSQLSLIHPSEKFNDQCINNKRTIIYYRDRADEKSNIKIELDGKCMKQLVGRSLPFTVENIFDVYSNMSDRGGHPTDTFYKDEIGNDFRKGKIIMMDNCYEISNINEINTKAFDIISKNLDLINGRFKNIFGDFINDGVVYYNYKNDIMEDPESKNNRNNILPSFIDSDHINHILDTFMALGEHADTK